jgi:hypothetical protein
MRPAMCAVCNELGSSLHSDNATYNFIYLKLDRQQQIIERPVLLSSARARSLPALYYLRRCMCWRTLPSASSVIEDG